MSYIFGNNFNDKLLNIVIDKKNNEIYQLLKFHNNF